MEWDQNNFCRSLFVSPLFLDFFQDWRRNVRDTKQYDQALDAVAVSKSSLFLHDPPPKFVLTSYLTSPTQFLMRLVLFLATVAIAPRLTVLIVNKSLKA